MKRTATILMLGVLLCGLGPVGAADESPAVPAPEPAVVKASAEEAKRPAPADQERHVDLVICLDTSGSMSGLIESAKQKLWAVVNELATAKPKPILRVGLYHYGNSGLKSETGWVQQLCPLTRDLDEVYGKLFPLRTNGGTEYVARVLHAATNELEWSPGRNTLRMIFVAGNEPATQDQTHKLQDVCRAAAGKGIIVNTIHCGDEATGRNTGWYDAARWADGQYASIDQNHGTVVIATPHDKSLLELNEKLNKTYVVYGREGQVGKANQVAQDTNAAQLGTAAGAGRVSAKASGLYHNATWDLVDASAEKDFDLAKVKVEDLPEAMRSMSVPERKAYLQTQAQGRRKITEEIRSLSAKRDAFVKAEMSRKGLSEKASFDAVLRRAVREQAERKNLRFEPAPKAPAESTPPQK